MRDAVVSEVDALYEQQVAEQRAVDTCQAIVSQPHDLNRGLAPQRVVV